MVEFKWVGQNASNDRDIDSIQSFSNSLQKVEEYYDRFRENKKLVLGDKTKLVYRREQHRFSRDIMNSIRNNEILLIQAGVGVGKSIGYLIPVFYTYDNVSKFNKIIISTSSIALQQQLLTDVNFVSNLLGIDIKVGVAKGINNYICLNRLEKAIRNAKEDDKKVLKMLHKDMLDKSTIDKDELIKINDYIWEKVKMLSRSSCKRCIYYKDCYYREIEDDLASASIVITNHGNLVNSVINDNEYVSKSDMLIIDEAHKMEEAIGSVTEGKLSLNYLKSILDFYIINNIVDEKEDIEKISNFKRKLESLYFNVMQSASTYFCRDKNDEQDVNITDCDKIYFNVRELKEELDIICNELEYIILIIKQYNYRNGYKEDHKVDILMNYFSKFADMKLGDYSDNIYWANYYRKNKIDIGFRIRDNFKISKNIFESNIPIVCTSGTMLDLNGRYDGFKRDLGLDKISPRDRTVTDGRIHYSPYDYDNNCLFYYDDLVTNPKVDYKKYIDDLVVKISELITITNGRTLILFTSKNSMNEVYNRLKDMNFGFDLMIQGESSSYKLCKKFQSNVKSCLFATGAFWEGIDIKGRSLCNVIITRLPFSNVDAITKSKARDYNSIDAFNIVYLNFMLQKLVQGTGRLIRGEKDKGVICCLDSRFSRYIDYVKNCTSYTNFTNDIDDVIEFSSRYITNRDKNIKTKKRS